MNKSEASLLLGDLARYDLRRFGDDDVIAWQEALADVTYEDAKQAVVGYYRDSRERAYPSDIRKIALLAADDRAARASWAGDGAGGCGRAGCPCTHTAPCDHGWVDAATLRRTALNRQTGEFRVLGEYDAVRPCEVCKPDRKVAEGESRDGWLGRLRAQNAAWKNRQRQPAA